MKWFAKYWWLRTKYELLKKQYDELVLLIDKSFWERNDYE